MLLYSRTKKKLTIKAVERRLGVRVVPEGAVRRRLLLSGVRGLSAAAGQSCPQPPAVPLQPCPLPGWSCFASGVRFQCLLPRALQESGALPVPFCLERPNG